MPSTAHAGETRRRARRASSRARARALTTTPRCGGQAARPTTLRRRASSPGVRWRRVRHPGNVRRADDCDRPSGTSQGRHGRQGARRCSAVPRDGLDTVRADGDGGDRSPGRVRDPSWPAGLLREQHAPELCGAHGRRGFLGARHRIFGWPTGRRTQTTQQTLLRGRAARPAGRAEASGHPAGRDSGIGFGRWSRRARPRRTPRGRRHRVVPRCAAHGWRGPGFGSGADSRRV
jgi:hypothetical protein